jgi:hypothetical protein
MDDRPDERLERATVPALKCLDPPLQEIEEPEIGLDAFIALAIGRIARVAFVKFPAKYDQATYARTRRDVTVGPHEIVYAGEDAGTEQIYKPGAGIPVTGSDEAGKIQIGGGSRGIEQPDL